jgi:hypothetical protein
LRSTPITRTWNTSNNLKTSDDDKLDGLLNSHNIISLLGTTHLKANFLSRPPNLDKGENDNKNTILLPSDHFHTLEIRLYDAETVLEDYAYPIQKQARHTPFDKYELQVKKGLETKNQHYYDDKNGLIYYKNLLYIPPNVQLRTKIIQKHHDSIIAGHPR